MIVRHVVREMSCLPYRLFTFRGVCSLGILPRDGKNISFKELNRTIRATYNFAPTFCFFVPNFSAGFLKKKYSTDTFNLADLNLHSEQGIEHDASLTSTSRLYQL